MELSLILFMLTQLCVPKKGQVYLYLAMRRVVPSPEGSWSPDCYNSRADHCRVFISTSLWKTLRGRRFLKQAT